MSKWDEDMRRRLAAAQERGARTELRRLVRNGADPRNLTQRQHILVLEAATRAMHREAEIVSRAGCVTLRKCRKTGTMVGLYNAEESGMDPESGPWVTVCEDHGGCVNHLTRAVAESHLSHPDEWCSYCQGDRNA